MANIQGNGPYAYCLDFGTHNNERLLCLHPAWWDAIDIVTVAELDEFDELHIDDVLDFHKFDYPDKCQGDILYVYKTWLDNRRATYEQLDTGQRCAAMAAQVGE